MAYEKTYDVSNTRIKDDGYLGYIWSSQISGEQMEELAKKLEGYLLKIDVTDSSSYDDSDDTRASCSSSSHDRVVYGEIEPETNSKSLVFIDGKLRGVAFFVKPTNGGSLRECIFLFDKSVYCRMVLGYSASHSSRHTTVTSVSLVPRGQKGAPEKGGSINFVQSEMYPSI